MTKKELDLIEGIGCYMIVDKLADSILAYSAYNEKLYPNAGHPNSRGGAKRTMELLLKAIQES